MATPEGSHRGSEKFFGVATGASLKKQLKRPLPNQEEAEALQGATRMSLVLTV